MSVACANYENNKALQSTRGYALSITLGVEEYLYFYRLIELNIYRNSLVAYICLQLGCVLLSQ